MKIELSQNYKSLLPFSAELPSFVVLTGLNGAGKTQLLTGLSENIILAYEEDETLQLIKYIPSQQLVYFESGPASNNFMENQIFSIWNRYTMIRNQITSMLQKHRRDRTNEQILLDMLRTEPNNDEIIYSINYVADQLKISIFDINQNDLVNHFPIREYKSGLFNQNLSRVFKRYYDKLEVNRYNQFRSKIHGEDVEFVSNDEFVKRYGEAPWELINNIFQKFNSDYEVTTPIGLHRSADFLIGLRNKINNSSIGFEDLSSGEKVLIGLLLALYNSEFDVELPKLLLLDEPDASLHPSMAKLFINVVQEVFVKAKGINVILTTHSAATIAIAPEESIYLLSKSEKSISKISKDSSIKALTVGVPSLSINYENRRQVFVESPFDVIYYDKIYNKIISHLEPEISLVFISSGESRTDKNGQKVSNCGQVINIVRTLINAGNRTVFGIIDWDLTNDAEEKIFVLGRDNRYGVENFIFDPLLVSMLLIREKLINKIDLSLSEKENFFDIKNFDTKRLQYVCDLFCRKIEHKFSITNFATKEIHYLNGNKICAPIWYLECQGHLLESILLNEFPGLQSLKKHKEEALKLVIIDKIMDEIPDFIPYDFLQILKLIQSS